MSSQYLVPVYAIDEPQYVADTSLAELKNQVFNEPRSDLLDETLYVVEVKDSDNWLMLSEAKLQWKFSVERMEDDVAVPIEISDQLHMPDELAVFDSASLYLNGKLHSTISEPATIRHIMSSGRISSDYAPTARNSGWYPLLVPELTAGKEFRLPDAASPPGIAVGESFPRAINTHRDIVMDRLVNDPENPGIAEAVIQVDIRPNDFYDENNGLSIKRLVDEQANGKWVSSIIPLKELFPCLSMLPATRGMILSVELTANRTASTILYQHNNFGANAAITPRVRVRTVNIWVPVVEPSATEKLSLQNQLLDLSSAGPLSKPFVDYQLQRHRNFPSSAISSQFKIKLKTDRALFAIVGFQLSASRSLLNANPLNFPNFGLSSLEIVADGVSYPMPSYRYDDDDRAYHDLLTLFGKTNKFDMSTGTLLTRKRYDGPMRFYGFDMYKSAVGDKRTIDVELRYQFSATPPGNYDVVVFVGSKKTLKMLVDQGSTVV